MTRQFKPNPICRWIEPFGSWLGLSTALLFGKGLRVGTILLTSLALNPCAVVVPGAMANEVGEIAQQVLSSKDYQRQLPFVPPESVPSDKPMAPSAGHGTKHFDNAEPQMPDKQDNAPETARGLGDLGSLLILAFALIGGALLVFYLFNNVPSRTKQGSDEKNERAGDVDHTHRTEVPSPDAAEARNELDLLVSEGRFGDAIHTLLLRSLKDLQARLDVSLMPSLTSREILKDLNLADETGAALGRIVTTVERNYFGGRASSIAEYNECLESYRRIARQGTESL